MFGLISKKQLTKEIVELYESISEDYFNSSSPSENLFYYCCGGHNALNYLSYRFNLGITEIIKENNHQKFFEKYWQAPKEYVEKRNTEDLQKSEELFEELFGTMVERKGEQDE